MSEQHAGARAFAWAGAVLFAAALAYFLFSYSVTFGEIATGNATTRAVAINVLLFSAFALHHSVFARLPVRAFVRRIVPSQLERSAYVWVASLMLIAVCFYWQAVPGVVWQVSSPWNWAVRLVQLAGIWLTLRSAAVIDGLELAGVRQVSHPESQIPHPTSQMVEFKTDGPYGWVRHPIYLGWILVVFSVGTMTMTRLVFATISSVYLLVAIPFEERTIRAQSPSYGDYMRRVPRKLIPRVY
ncbi:MAG TPA: isoprenylcysteine carboxylmethyltransferase family protein [Vicinamibacterales bacterium]|nr:isoprenylcysteine carboxylmethyltransferase family protein [Vicinamibacterales bacterium]